MIDTSDVKGTISSGSLISLEDINTKMKLISVDSNDNFNINAIKIAMPSTDSSSATIIEATDIYCHDLSAMVKMDASALTMSARHGTSGKTLSLDFTKASGLTADKTIYVAPEGGNMLTDSNIKTIFGNSLYGSGNITAAFDTSYFTLKNPASSSNKITVTASSGKTGNYTIFFPAKQGTLGMATQITRYNSSTNNVQTVEWASSSEFNFSNTKITLSSGYSYLIIGWVDANYSDANTIVMANVRVYNSTGSTKRFERGCRTTMHSGGGCTVAAFYRCENVGDYVILNSYNYRGSNTVYRGSLYVYEFQE